MPRPRGRRVLNRLGCSFPMELSGRDCHWVTESWHLGSCKCRPHWRWKRSHHDLNLVLNCRRGLCWPSVEQLIAVRIRTNWKRKKRSSVKADMTYTQSLHQCSIAQATRLVTKRVGGVIEGRRTARLITTDSYHQRGFNSRNDDAYSTPMIWKRCLAAVFMKSFPCTTTGFTAQAVITKAQSAIKIPRYD